jgi:acyl carrier protein
MAFPHDGVARPGVPQLMEPDRWLNPGSRALPRVTSLCPSNAKKREWRSHLPSFKMGVFTNGQRGVEVQDSPRVTREIIRSALRLASDADTARSFHELGVDSWDLIELRALLETRFELNFPDAEWVSMECPDDIVRAVAPWNDRQ